MLCWAVLRAPAGKLLAPILPDIVLMLRAERPWTSPTLARMSAATGGWRASGRSSCRMAGPTPSPDRC